MKSSQTLAHDYKSKMSKLQNIRNERGLSQGKLAKESEISVRMIQNYEQGTNDLNGAKLSTMLKLCLALNCDLSDILDDTETLELLRKYEAR